MPQHHKEWERAGRTDPYFGVLSCPEYRAECITEESLSTFYQTGEEHVRQLLRLLQTMYASVGMNSVLDFGCGVGRLVIPFAQHFSRAVGVDISASMIALAQKRTSEVGLQNVTFVNRIDEAAESFDLAHSYLVFQHIPWTVGRPIIDKIAERVRPGGVIALHFVLKMRRSWIRNVQHSVRKRVTPWHYAINLIGGNRWDEPLQEMNAYPLTTILYSLHQRDFSHFQVVTSMCTSFGPDIFSAFVFGQKNSRLSDGFSF